MRRHPTLHPARRQVVFWDYLPTSHPYSIIDKNGLSRLIAAKVSASPPDLPQAQMPNAPAGSWMVS